MYEPSHGFNVGDKNAPANNVPIFSCSFLGGLWEFFFSPSLLYFVEPVMNHVVIIPKWFFFFIYLTNSNWFNVANGELRAQDDNHDGVDILKRILVC